MTEYPNGTVKILCGFCHSEFEDVILRALSGGGCKLWIGGGVGQLFDAPNWVIGVGGKGVAIYDMEGEELHLCGNPFVYVAPPPRGCWN